MLDDNPASYIEIPVTLVEYATLKKIQINIVLYCV